ncbi:D-alanyl-D-alanine carboxypeptidase [Streptomyces sp. NPDC057555]|uniref:D-alanyl-D-alanine carboxypeptidase n=1 Tax=Streptomyces sp. NPDC057555 TaxID=3346166 RepID=UPI00368B68DC
MKASEAAQKGASGDAEGESKAKGEEGRQRAAAPAGVKGGAAEKAAADEKSEPAKKAEPAKEAGSAEEGEPAEEAVDQATAVFSTTGVKKRIGAQKGKDESADEAPADNATRVFAVAKAGKSAASGKGDEEGPVDQPTTAFKLGKDADKDAGKAADASTGKGDKATDKATGAAKADASKADDAKSDDAKDSDAKDSEAKGKGRAGAGERDAERTSQFVALKSSDNGSAERSIGKTAPKTPLGKPGSTSDPDADQDAAKDQGKEAGAASGGKEAEKSAEKSADKAADKAPGKAADKAADKAAGKTAGAMPAAAAETSERKADATKPGGGADGVSAADAEAERTRQEPLPPLDLLAKLTNTPPPPETPMRTIVRRIKVWTPIVVLLGIIFVVVQSVRPLPNPKLALTADAKHSFGGSSPSLPWPGEGQAVVDIDGLGRMGSQGEMKPLPIGSVAKVMTTYLILKDHPLKKGEDGPSIDVDQKAEDDYVNGKRENESVVEMKKGQKISEREALEAVMLPSANNAARLLARWDAGDEEAFIKKMNDTAKELGMTNTTYTDASGLKESTVSTAEDQVKLAKKAMADPTFRAMARMPSYHATTASGGAPLSPEAKEQKNFNKLVPLYGVVGIKTGSTTKAGGNLLFAAEKKVGDTTQLIIGAVFGQHKNPPIDTAMWASRDLILAAGKQLETQQVVKKGQVVGQVDDGLGGTTPVVATKDMDVIGWPGAAVELKLNGNGKPVPHEAKAGTEVGVLTAGSGLGEIEVPVALQSDLAEPSFGAKVTRIS